MNERRRFWFGVVGLVVLSAIGGLIAFVLDLSTFWSGAFGAFSGLVVMAWVSVKNEEDAIKKAAEGHSHPPCTCMGWNDEAGLPELIDPNCPHHGHFVSPTS